MKNLGIGLVLVSLLLGIAMPAAAVTVYLKDGTQLEVDKVVRIGDTVCLYLDISRIDTAKTPVKELREELGMPSEVAPGSLAVTNFELTPSEDNTEIIATGNVDNQTQHTAKNIRVTLILMDKQDTVLSQIHGFARPDVLEPGQTGNFRFQVKKPEGFWKASVELKADADQSPK